ncbi:MAG: nuclear transport factor 2 family protein [Nitrosomonas sp.]|nr:MAG: nuclear transport factor 2 family protein [Nitrosomonas sp.]
MESSVIAGLIQHLELKLLQSDLTAHPGLIDELLAEDFEEIDNHGQLHSRDDVIGWLRQKDPHRHWVFKDFRVKVLTDNLVLAIYSLQKPGQPDTGSMGSIRTSLWQRHEGHWKMAFHQATKITETSAS